MKKYYSDGTENGGITDGTGDWGSRLEEAIHRQTIKETSEYDQNKPEDDSVGVTHRADGGDEPDAVKFRDSDYSDSAGTRNIQTDSDSRIFRRSRNFADPDDFRYDRPEGKPEVSSAGTNRTVDPKRSQGSDQEKTQESAQERDRESFQESDEESTPERIRESVPENFQGGNSENIPANDPKGSRTAARESRKHRPQEEKHVSFSDRYEEHQRDQEAADEAVRDSDAVLFDEIVDDDRADGGEDIREDGYRDDYDSGRGNRSGRSGRYYGRDDASGRDYRRREEYREDYNRSDGTEWDSGEDDVRYSRDFREYDDRHSDDSHGRRMSRKEQKEYEEFLRYKEQVDRQERKGKKKKKHRLLKFFIWLAVILVVLYCLFTIALRMLGIRRSDLNMQDITNTISDQVKQSAKDGAMAYYRNIALFGVDSIDQSLDAGNNRTDVMIIASINELTGDVKLVSLYRDTYLDIGNANYQKANAAYAFGGPDQAVSMINRNLDLNVQDYVTVGFGGVADMIDAVGGIEIDVQEDEIEHLNNYQSTMAQELGKEYVPVTQTGNQTLNGLQATAYCRIRYTDGGDFKRTERQKEVLSKTFAKLKAAGPATMIRAARSLSSEMRTSLSTGDISLLALQAFRYNITDTNGFPQENLRTVGYIGDQSCVIPIHLTDNDVWLHRYLFSDTSYTVSPTVQTISDQISANSGY